MADKPEIHILLLDPNMPEMKRNRVRSQALPEHGCVISIRRQE
jgi:hypothetical protein